MKKLLIVLALIVNSFASEISIDPSENLSIKTNFFDVLPAEIIEKEIGNWLYGRAYQKTRLVCKKFRDSLKADGKVIMPLIRINGSTISQDLDDLDNLLIANKNASGVNFWAVFGNIARTKPKHFNDDQLYIMKNCLGLLSFSLSDMSNLTQLDLGFFPLTDKTINILTRLPKLQELNLGCKNQYRDSIMTLPSLPNLKTLNIATSSHLQLGNLKHFQKLETLNFFGTPDQTTLDVIGQLPALTQLYNMIINDPLLFPPMKNLRVLSIGGTLTPTNMDRIAQCSNLKKLILSHVKLLENNQLTVLGNLTNLTTLDMSGININNQGIIAISKFVNLTSLDLAFCEHIKGGEFVPLKNLKHLTKLNVQFTEFNDTDMNILLEFPYLTDLSLSYCTHILPKKFTLLHHLKLLNILDVSETHIKLPGLKSIATLKKLRILKLISCKNIQYKNLKFLKSLHNLEELDTANTFFGNRCLKIISQLPSFRTLITSACPNMTSEGFAYLACLKTLTNLTVCRTQFNDNNLWLLLKELPSLKTIQLSGAQVSKEAITLARKSYPNIELYYND